jgi:hypothetical protein
MSPLDDELFGGLGTFEECKGARDEEEDEGHHEGEDGEEEDRSYGEDDDNNDDELSLCLSSIAYSFTFLGV